MNEKARLATRGLFGIALICFVLPFATVSCQGKPIATLSGIDVAFGASLDASALPVTPGEAVDFQTLPKEQQEAAMTQLIGSAQAQAIGSSPWAIAAIAVAIAGLGAALFAGHAAGPVPAALAGAGAVLLFLMKARVENQVSGPTMGMGQVEWNAGFWLCLLGFVANAALNGYLAATGQSGQPREAPDRGPGTPSRSSAQAAIGRAYPAFGETLERAGPSPEGSIDLPGETGGAQSRTPIPVAGYEPAGVDD